MNKFNKIFFILLIFLPIIGFSQADIRIFLNNQEGSVFYFCKYRGAKTTVIDTLTIPELSIFNYFRYHSKEKLPEGIYLLKNSKNFPVTEILIGKKQIFTLYINDLEDLNTYKVKGRAKETATYFKLMAKVRQTEANIAALASEKDHYPENVRKIDSLRQDLEKFEESLKTKKKDTFINIVIRSLKQHDFEHYWDNFPLDDARILTYPLIDNKLDTYFDNLYANAPKINNEIDKIIAKTGDCVEVRDYLIWYFYRKYYSPKYMNLDDVYIHLVDEYFLKLEMRNVSESVVNLMADRANYLENLKIGAKLPEIGHLYSIDAQYIAVVFYDKTCHKCAQEGRILEEIKSRHPEMVIFPVEVNSTGIENLLSLYDIQTTPMIYVLDKQKHIIAKRLKAEQVEQILNMD